MVKGIMVKITPVLAALALALSPALVAAEHYSDDELCRAIGETPNAALQPRDRLFFEKKCSCVVRYGCAATASKRWREIKLQREKDDAQLRATEAELAAKRAAEKALKQREAREVERTSCERLLPCLAEFSESECHLLYTRMEEACLERGGLPTDCMKRSQAVGMTKKCADPP
jgi:hypothetical protein